jgi:hypothetical protein
MTVQPELCEVMVCHSGDDPGVTHRSQTRQGMADLLARAPASHEVWREVWRRQAGQRPELLSRELLTPAQRRRLLRELAAGAGTAEPGAA